MTYTVILSPRALDDLIALDAYIADASSPAVAARYTDAVADFCHSLSALSQAHRDRVCSRYRGTAGVDPRHFPWWSRLRGNLAGHSHHLTCQGEGLAGVLIQPLMAPLNHAGRTAILTAASLSP